MKFKKNNPIKMDSIDAERRINNVYDYMYKIEEKLDKLIKYLQDVEADPCKSKILELISGKRPF